MLLKCTGEAALGKGAAMRFLVDHPLILALVAFVSLWLCAWIGSALLREWFRPPSELRADVAVVLAASLTLLGLLIGFTFSMATARYDLRKQNEANEANAIGTEYLRADLLPQADAERLKALLREYLGQRIKFYTVRASGDSGALATDTATLQRNLWTAVTAPARAQQTAILTLAVAGMNDVLNAQGYTVAGYLNRIPISAWLLMALIAVLCNLMIGYTQQANAARVRFLAVLPLVVSVAVFLISDIDSPRGGVVRIAPQNLLVLATSLK
jgi:hypothetical protein